MKNIVSASLFSVLLISFSLTFGFSQTASAVELDCLCVESTVKPAGNPNITFVRTVATDPFISVIIVNSWDTTVRCQDIDDATINCVEIFQLSQESENWVVNIPNGRGAGVAGTVVNFPSFVENTPGGTPQITCTGKCDGVVVPKRISTKLILDLEAPAGGRAGLGITGDVTLSIRGTVCTIWNAFDMKIHVDSARPNNFDPLKSDLDGDGLNGYQEGKLKTSDFSPNPDGAGNNTGPNEDKDGDGVLNKDDAEPTNKKKQ